MNSILKVVNAGMCTGCGACDICKNITLENGPLGFPVPHVGNECTGCGKCLSACIYDPDREDY